MPAKPTIRVNVGPLFDRQPPHAREAEAAVLGAMMLDPSVTPEAADRLTSEDFYDQKHALIFESLVEQYRVTGDKADMVLWHRRLQDAGVLEQVGGVEYLIQLSESVPSSASIGYYAAIVRDRARMRDAIEIAGRVLYDCYHHDTSSGTEHAPELIERGLTAFADLAERSLAGDDATVTADVAMALAKREVEHRAENPGLGGIATGFVELDDALDGLRGGQMIVVAARPSIGKTAFATNIAENIAEAGEPVAIFSLEMSHVELAKRMLASRSGVPLGAMKHPASCMNMNDWEALSRVLLRAKDRPLYIVDSPDLTMERLHAMGQKLVTRRGVKCLIVDYLQLMTAPRADNREQQVAALSRGIKLLARRLNVPIVLLAQVNRAAEGENPGPPMAKHIRESGAVEQDADVILALHRDDFYRIQLDPEHQPDHSAIVAIRKQRNGPQGAVKLYFDAQRSRFGNWTQQDQRRIA